MKPTLVCLGLCLVLFDAAESVVAQSLPVLQRAANTTLNMPQAPQSLGFKTERAYGTVTFSMPVSVRSVPGETNRIFVVEQGGKIFAITNLAAPNKTLFLDLSKRVAVSDNEGLFGLAFHPGYATNGYFYLGYNLNTTSPAGTGRHYRVGRFQVSDANPNVALTNSELPLITQKNGTASRTCNDLAFGPDGYLYIAVGWISTTTSPANHSQRIDGSLEGGILRIDVDKRPESLAPIPFAGNSTNYSIPWDNPFVGATQYNGAPVNADAVRTEYYATGMRNPWRMSFDAATGLLYCSDAGESQREEINIVVKGGNYGWAFREGTINGPRATVRPPDVTLIDPIHEYRHTSGVLSVVIGGVVYRGDRLPQLQGAYIFGDLLTANVWALRYAGNGPVTSQKLVSEGSIAAYGTDPSNGDLLLVNYDGGVIKRLVYNSTLVGTPLPPTLADTGAFTNLKSLTPEAGIVPYNLNVPFWSDNARKTRWFCLPNLSQTMIANAEDHWLFPTGMVWIKHFELELTKGVPESAHRVETRFLVRNSDGAYGVTYRWGDSLTNATLVPAEGLDEEFEIDDGGVKRKQTWHYPSRAECLTCHTPLTGHALGFNTQQLNRDFDHVAENQVRALSDAGYLQTPLSGWHTLPALAQATNESASLDYRVHSYLAANCSQCHRPGGIGRGLFDARITTPLSAAGIIDGPLLNDFGDSQNRVVKPGSLEKSVLFSRLANLGERHMPPLATSVLNTDALNLLRNWITNGLADYKSFADWQVAQFGATNAANAGPYEDADGDGVLNQWEYVSGTNPLLASDAWGIGIVRNGLEAEVRALRMAGRGFEIQWTTTLSDPNSWRPLDVPGNEPVFPATTTSAKVQDSLTNAPSKFYRARLLEP